MPIISKIEAKTTKGRVTHAIIFTLLTLGGVTMIYPFILMLSGSLRSELDETDLDLVPAFFFNTDVLYQKFLETKYNQNIQIRNRAHLRQDFNFRSAHVPETVNPALVEDFHRFFAETEPPLHWQTPGGIFGVRTVPENLRTIRNRLVDRFDNDLDAFNREVGAVLPSWQTLLIPPPQWETQRYEYPDNILYETTFALLDELPVADRVLLSLSGYFLETMIFPVYGQMDTGAFNQAFEVEPLAEYLNFSLPRRVPPVEQPRFRVTWMEFVREELNPSFVLLDGVEARDFHDHLQEIYGTVEELNHAWGTRHASISDVPLPSGQWLRGAFRADYLEFLDTVAPEHYVLTGPEFAWRDWLAEQYGGVEAVNAAHGTAHPVMEAVRLPVEEVELAYVLDNTTSLRLKYSVRNYINVSDELFLRGRAFLNTMIFCTLSVLFSLLVNPLTAYALSRFELPGSYKILLFVMATMAFPPMVTLIPTFIILQNLNLMNTFAALVLPTIANGYLIFLLKGFFDSLPRELYHAAMIDGASEIRIFFQITMALSKPILAVVALMAFNSSYTMFLYPLLVAPRQDMWLLSVWLYQYQLSASMAGVFASVIVASVPTLLIFIFAQNIIMRGIVVPTEK